MGDTPSRRIGSFDGLRGVAALVVLVAHTLLAVPAFGDLVAGRPARLNGFEWALTYTPLHLVWAGTEAVTVFFLLSGFVLTVLATRAGFHWSSYYPSRLVRLYLPVVASLVVALACYFAVPRRSGSTVSFWLGEHARPVSLLSVLRDAFLLSGTSTLNNPLWSLQWEVLFSLLLPLYVLVIVRFRRIWPLLGLLAMAASIGGAVIAHPIAQYPPVFAVGVALAVGQDDIAAFVTRWVTPAQRGLAVLLALLLLPATWYFPGVAGRLAFGLTLAAGVVLLIGATHYDPMRAVLSSRPVRWLGTISFSLYLAHEPIIVSLGLVLSPGLVWLTPVLGIPLGLLAGWGFFMVVERPSHRLSRAISRRIDARVRARTTAPQRA